MSDAHAEDVRKHVKIYITVFAALAALTVVTVAVSYLRLPTLPAVVLALMARNRMQGFSPVPEQTVDTLKEDVQWIRQQRS